MKLNFEYNTVGQNDNNGNVLKQTIKVPDTINAMGFTAIQTYSYDELNRLKSAEEKIANVTSWKQTFTFDRYGNKRFDESNTDTLQGGCATAVCNPTIDPATNKLVGYTFDNAGNTQTDANGQTFTYDAENKQILVKDSLQNTVGEYFYDGDGKRIKKKTATEETIFVYNGSGQLVADYSTQIAQQPKVSYLTSDHLGSPRITTDKDGDVYTRRDFMPFGEEIDVGHTSQRNATLHYATDEIRQKFTSYERDNETELDFAQARMYGYGFGRFTSPDPLAASANPIRPQSWNRYSYSYNNPLRFTDPSGMIASDYVNEDGIIIGSDGSKETKLYFVANETERITVIENRKAGTTTKLSSLNSALELPNADVRQEIGVDAVKRTKQKVDGKKGFHEEGGAVYETANGQIAVPAKPGSNGVPGQSGGAEINVMDAADPNLMKQVADTTPLLTYHVHPGGTKKSVSLIDGKQARTIKGFKQEPSKEIDIPNAANRKTKLGYNIVVGAGSKMIGTTINNKVPNGGQRVYFYNGSGVIGSMSINGFVKAGRR